MTFSMNVLLTFILRRRARLCLELFAFEHFIRDAMALLRESYALVWRNFYVSSHYLIELIAPVPQDSDVTLLRASLLTVCVLFMPLFVLVSCFMLYISFSDWLI